VAVKSETASFLLYSDYVSLPVRINDLEWFLEEKSVKLSGFIVVSDQNIIADSEMRFLAVLRPIYFIFVFSFPFSSSGLLHVPWRPLRLLRVVLENLGVVRGEKS